MVVAELVGLAHMASEVARVLELKSSVMAGLSGLALGEAGVGEEGEVIEMAEAGKMDWGMRKDYKTGY